MSPRWLLTPKKGNYMRKGKRFTPGLLDKWEFEDGRGEGIYSEYQPWHQVTRSDPASRGRSHLTFCPDTLRLHHHLSDGEQLMYSFARMTPNVIDIREQFKLETSGHYHALSHYSIKYANYIERGTLEISAQLGIKHPVTRSGAEKGNWRFSTDFLLTLKKPDKGFDLIAIAYKPLHDLLNPRKRNLLRIEKAYWQEEGATWLLITPHQYSISVASTVKTVFPWVMHPVQASQAIKKKCADIAKTHIGWPLRDVLRILSIELGIDASMAAPFFYQAVWSGMLPLDLSRSRFISDPMLLLSMEDFWRQNPIAIRRSACL